VEDWDDLRVFLAVARAQSLSGAGRLLKCDPATVGRRIARLEAGAGQRFFAKSPLGYALTDEGGRILRHAEAMEAAQAQARAALAGAGEGLTGQVRIGAPDGCANYLLPQVVAGLAARHPGLEIQIVALPRVFNLTRREADMAIAISLPPGGKLVAQKIADYRLVFAASDGYLAAAPALDSIADLLAHRIVGYIPDMIFDPELDYLTPLGLEPRLASNSVSVQMNLIRQGAGVGVVHAFALPFAPGLRPVLAADFGLTRSFHLIRHEADRHLPRQERLARALAAGLRREIARLEREAAG
jgi:DNA-binding transcriptional LysR family regulator